MKKFKFSLQPILDVRKRVEEEQRQAFVQRLGELRTAQAELARFHESMGLDSRHARREYLDRCISLQYAAISRCRLAVERARANVAAAIKAREPIDRLKEKRFADHRALERLTEQRELDDVNGRIRSASR